MSFRPEESLSARNEPGAANVRNGLTHIVRNSVTLRCIPKRGDAAGSRLFAYGRIDLP